MARGLAILCLVWLPFHHQTNLFGAARPIAETLFSLIFIVTSVFMLLGSAVLTRSARVASQLTIASALLMLLMLTRNYLETISGWLGMPPAALLVRLDLAYYSLPVLAAALLWRLSAKPWQELQPLGEPAAA